MTDTQSPEKTPEQQIVKDIYELLQDLNRKVHQAAMLHNIYFHFDLKPFKDLPYYHHQILMPAMPNKITVAWP